MADLPHAPHCQIWGVEGVARSPPPTGLGVGTAFGAQAHTRPGRFHLVQDTQSEGREALRLSALHELAKGRISFAGLEHGADRKRSTALLQHIEDPYLDGFVRNMLAGREMWGVLRMALGEAEHLNYVWCRSAPDTSEHLLVSCPATAPIRAWAAITPEELLALPPCVLRHAVFPKRRGERGRGPSLR